VRIFISYRRDDQAASTQLADLRKRLQRRYGKSSVFVDRWDMQLGKDYKDDLHLKISRCDFMLVLIGPEWERILVDRKDSVFEDPVVYEIKTALELQIQIVPVLVISNPDKGVHTLSPNQLPQSIRAFELRNLEARQQSRASQLLRT
jgi:hypothetical protein